MLVSFNNKSRKNISYTYMYMLRNVCVYVYVYIFIYISANVIRDTVKRENIPDIKRIMQIIILY